MTVCLSISDTDLSVVGHSAEELQLQVQLTRVLVQQQPHTAGQVLSAEELRLLRFYICIVFTNLNI